ncbi:MAG: hypothetical protein ABSF38_02650 [Verrucomicrobiota bacterium]|jgi:flagellin-like hook-associated protein FlgL
MIINTSLPADSTAADLQNSRPAAASAGSPNAGSPPAATDTTSDRMRELSLAGQDGDWASQDIAAADRWTGFLRSNIPSRAGTALAAQANQNPETVFSLLQ